MRRSLSKRQIRQARCIKPQSVSASAVGCSSPKLLPAIPTFQLGPARFLGAYERAQVLADTFDILNAVMKR